MTLEERQKMKERRDMVMDFIDTPVHRIYVKSTQAQLDLEQERMLDDPTTSHDEWLELRAQRRLLKASLTFFEDIVSVLTNQIDDELPDLEKQNETQLETNDYI